MRDIPEILRDADLSKSRDRASRPTPETPGPKNDVPSGLWLYWEYFDDGHIWLALRFKWRGTARYLKLVRGAAY